MVMLSARADATRQTILQAAIRCFAARGFKATTTRAVAAEAGVTSPLIHHYFGDKEQLFEAATAKLVADYERAQEAQWAREPDDVGFFTEGLRVLFDWTGSDLDRVRFMTWARLEGRTGNSRAAAELTERVRGKFAAAQIHGVLRADLDIDAAMMAIDAWVKGYWQQEAFHPALTDRENLRERVFSLSLRILLEGLLTPQALTRARGAYPSLRCRIENGLSRE
ncbi:MAG: helix-turn-helix domain-containing protein [Myxococcota bacterium]